MRDGVQGFGEGDPVGVNGLNHSFERRAATINSSTTDAPLRRCTYDTVAHREEGGDGTDRFTNHTHERRPAAGRSLQATAAARSMRGTANVENSSCSVRRSTASA